MGSVPVIPGEITLQVFAQMGTILEGFALVLHAAPEPLNEDVVLVTALAIHADPDLMGFQHVSKRLTGELAALIRVEDLGRPMACQGIFQGIDAEVGVQGIRYSPGQHTAAVPIHNGHQIHESACHRKVSHISCPDLVGAINDPTQQQVGVDPVPLTGATGARPRIYRLEPHLTHQSLDSLAVHWMSQTVEINRHPP